MRIGVLACVILLGLSSLALAQFRPRAAPSYGPGSRPNLSPYLNLIRGGDIATNYYLGTRSEQQRRSDARTFRTAINDLDVRTESPTDAGTVSFDNRAGYFNNTGAYFFRQNIPQPRTPPGQPPPRTGRR